MNVTNESLDRDLVVVGVSIRTSPKTAAKDIPALWQRFLMHQRPGRDVYAVYFDYEGDWQGAYSMIVGVEGDHVGERMVVPAGRYAKLAVQGEPSQVVWQGWQHINTEWSERARRRYFVDFERYPVGNTPRAEIMVGLR